MRLQNNACAKGDDKLDLRKRVASQHEGTWFQVRLQLPDLITENGEVEQEGRQSTPDHTI